MNDPIPNLTPKRALTVAVITLRRLAEWLFVLLSLYCVGILAYSPLAGSLPRGGLIILFLLIGIASAAASRWHWAYALIGWTALLAILIPFLNLSPVTEADWTPSCARLPAVEVSGNLATVHNLRDFIYTTPDSFIPRYETRVYNLDSVLALDLAVSHWGQDAIAHTLLVFRFEGGDNLVLSVETRLTVGQEQSPISGLFKSIPLIWILGTENDLLRLRSNFRREDLYLYPTRTTPTEARKALNIIFERINKLKNKPEFYNTLHANCTTTLADIIDQIYPGIPWDIRKCLNGYSDQLAFDCNWLPHPPDISYALYRSYFMVNLRTASLPDTAPSADYSALLRKGWDVKECMIWGNPEK